MGENEQYLEIVLRAKEQAEQAFRQVEGLLQGLQGRVQQVNRSMAAGPGGGGGFLANWQSWILTLNQGLQLYQQTIGRLVSAGAGFVRNILDQAGAFEAYRTRLTIVMGSQEEAYRTFDRLKQVARDTPFPIGDLVQATLILRRFGIESEDVRDKVVNLAAFLGTGAAEAAEKFARAYATGLIRDRELQAFVMLRTGVDNLTKVSLPALRKALLEAIASPELVGAAKKIDNDWQGMVNSLGDEWQQFLAGIGEAGFLDVVKDEMRSVLATIDEMRRDGRLQRLQTEISEKLGAAFKIVVQYVNQIDAKKVADTAASLGHAADALIRLLPYAAKLASFTFGGWADLVVALDRIARNQAFGGWGEWWSQVEAELGSGERRQRNLDLGKRLGIQPGMMESNRAFESRLAANVRMAAALEDMQQNVEPLMTEAPAEGSFMAFLMDPETPAVVKKTKNSVDDLGLGAEDAAQKAKDLAKQVQEITDQITVLLDPTKEAEVAIAATARSLTALNMSADDAKDLAEKLQAAKATKFLRELDDQMRHLRLNMSDADIEIEQVTEAMRAQGYSAEEAAKRATEFVNMKFDKGPLQDLRDEWRLLTGQITESQLAIEKLVRTAPDGMKEVARATATAVEQLKHGQIAMGSFIRDGIKQVGEAVVLGTRDMKEVGQGLAQAFVSNFFDKVLEDKLHDFDPKFNANFLKDLPGAVQSGTSMMWGFFSDLFRLIGGGFGALGGGSGEPLGGSGSSFGGLLSWGSLLGRLWGGITGYATGGWSGGLGGFIGSPLSSFLGVGGGPGIGGFSGIGQLLGLLGFSAPTGGAVGGLGGISSLGPVTGGFGSVVGGTLGPVGYGLTAVDVGIPGYVGVIDPATGLVGSLMPAELVAPEALPAAAGPSLASSIGASVASAAIAAAVVGAIINSQALVAAGDPRRVRNANMPGMLALGMSLPMISAAQNFRYGHYTDAVLDTLLPGLFQMIRAFTQQGPGIRDLMFENLGKTLDEMTKSRFFSPGTDALEQSFRRSVPGRAAIKGNEELDFWSRLIGRDLSKEAGFGKFGINKDITMLIEGGLARGAAAGRDPYEMIGRIMRQLYQWPEALKLVNAAFLQHGEVLLKDGKTQEEFAVKLGHVAEMFRRLPPSVDATLVALRALEEYGYATARNMARAGMQLSRERAMAEGTIKIDMDRIEKLGIEELRGGDKGKGEKKARQGIREGEEAAKQAVDAFERARREAEKGTAEVLRQSFADMQSSIDAFSMLRGKHGLKELPDMVNAAAEAISAWGESVLNAVSEFRQLRDESEQFTMDLAREVAGLRDVAIPLTSFDAAITRVTHDLNTATTAAGKLENINRLMDLERARAQAQIDNLNQELQDIQGMAAILDTVRTTMADIRAMGTEGALGQSIAEQIASVKEELATAEPEERGALAGRLIELYSQQVRDVADVYGTQSEEFRAAREQALTEMEAFESEAEAADKRQKEIGEDIKAIRHALADRLEDLGVAALTQMGTRMDEIRAQLAVVFPDADELEHVLADPQFAVIAIQAEMRDYMKVVAEWAKKALMELAGRKYVIPPWLEQYLAEPPEAQEGGYTRYGGLVRTHPNEVIIPLDDFRARRAMAGSSMPPIQVIVNAPPPPPGMTNADMILYGRLMGQGITAEMESWRRSLERGKRAV